MHSGLIFRHQGDRLCAKSIDNSDLANLLPSGRLRWTYARLLYIVFLEKERRTARLAPIVGINASETENMSGDPVNPTPQYIKQLFEHNKLNNPLIIHHVVFHPLMIPSSNHPPTGHSPADHSSDQPLSSARSIVNADNQSDDSQL